MIGFDAQQHARATTTYDGPDSPGLPHGPRPPMPGDNSPNGGPIGPEPGLG